VQRKRLALVVALAIGAIAVFVVSRAATRPKAQVSIVVEDAKGKNDRGKRSERAVAVEAAIARGAKTTTDIRAIGSLRSDESVQIASEIAGRIEQINFTEGGTVATGDVLVKLDDNLAEAQVADAKARFELAEANNERARKLSPSGFVTGKAIDEAAATFETARATLELGRVRLAKHVIKAPFPGVVGLRKVSPGSFIAVGTPIVNLEKIDIIKVRLQAARAVPGVGRHRSDRRRDRRRPPRQDLRRRDLRHRSPGRCERPRSGTELGSRVPAGARVHLPCAGSAVRELPRSADHPGHRAPVHDGRARHIVARRGHAQRVLPDRPGDPGGAHHEARIFIVEFANQLQEKGRDRLSAAIEAAGLRLRPILMTTGAMVLGALPLAIASGAGAESRQQIGWVIVGGMSFGTLLTLFIVPTVYSFLGQVRRVEEPAAAVAAPAE
jgi:biotin carboxyl carrier protein